MVEFVMTVPVIMIVFCLMLQLFVIMQAKIRVHMLEHELAMYSSSCGSHELRDIGKFAAEYAAVIGLDPSRLHVTNKSLQDDIPGSNFAVKAVKWVLNFLPDITNDAYGRDIHIAYDVKLMKFFGFMGKGGNLTVRTSVHAGVGDVWALDLRPSKVLDMVLQNVLKGAKWVVNLIIKFMHKVF